MREKVKPIFIENPPKILNWSRWSDSGIRFIVSMHIQSETYDQIFLKKSHFKDRWHGKLVVDAHLNGLFIVGIR